jgi:hypothetical protein
MEFDLSMHSLKTEMEALKEEFGTSFMFIFFSSPVHLFSPPYL